MEFDKQYLCLDQTSCVFNKSLDCEEEYQELLPQYCDDIVKVIKCTTKNIITSTCVESNNVKIYGKSYINITYINEDKCLSYTDFEEDFYKVIKDENIQDTAFIRANICDKYCNYRIINQRRIDIHNAFNIIVKVYDKITCPCLKNCENSKLKKNKIECSNIISYCNCKSEFDEEMEISADSQPIRKIIGYSGFVTLNETKKIKDKALVKANVSVDVLYTEDCEEEKISKCCYNFDISKIVEIDGLVEHDEIITELYLGNVFLKSKNSADGCLNIIEIIGDICIDLSVIRKREITYITDGYIVNKNSKCTYQDFKSNKNSKKVSDRITREYTIKFNSNIKEIYDIGLNIHSLNLKNNECNVNIKSNILYKNDYNELCNFDVNNDLVLFNDEFDNGICDVHICNFDYNLLDDSSIKLRVTLSYDAILYFELNEKVLSEIEFDDIDIEYPALTIYFAKENELVWNIAKKFSSDSDLIIKENGLKSDIVNSNKVLIIPGL